MATEGEEVKEGRAKKAGGQDPKRVPSIDFTTFVLSLSTTALYQMGLVPEPGSGEKTEPDVDLARHTIDTLEMLREKTRGNLDAEEQKLFDSLLYELRLRCVELER
jgi:hypothetical protein